MAAVQEIAVIADGSRDVRRRTHAPFDLAGGDAGARKRRDILPHAQVCQGEAICRRVKSLAVDGIFLSARLFAKTAVAAVSADHGGKIALPGKAGTQRALDEAFRLDLFRDARYVRKRRFPCRDHAGEPAFFGEARPLRVADARLRRKVQFHFRIAAFEHLPEEDVLYDQGVRAGVPCQQRAFCKVVRLALFDQSIERDVDLRAERVREARRPFQIFRRKIGGRFAGGKIL